VVAVVVLFVAVLVVDVDVVDVAVVAVAVVAVAVVAVAVVAVTVVAVVVVAVTDVVVVVVVVVGMQTPQRTGHFATTLAKVQPAIPTAWHVFGSGSPLHTGVVVELVAVDDVAVVVVEVVEVAVFVVDVAVMVVVVLQDPHSAGQMCGKSKRSKFGLLQNDPSPGLLHAIGSTSPLQIPLPSVETNITAATTATHAARLP